MFDGGMYPSAGAMNAAAAAAAVAAARHPVSDNTDTNHSFPTDKLSGSSLYGMPSQDHLCLVHKQKNTFIPLLKSSQLSGTIFSVSLNTRETQ